MNCSELGELRGFQRFDPDVIISEAKKHHHETSERCKFIKASAAKYRWNIGRMLRMMIATIINPRWEQLYQLMVASHLWECEDDKFIKVAKEIHEEIIILSYAVAIDL